MNKDELQPEENRKNVSSEKLIQYVETVKKMINCKTVFTRDFKYKNEFDRFYQVINASFPSVIKKAKKITFGSGCFVYILEGKDANKNIMLMSHHDVVKETDGWDTDAFEATEKNGALYGRGSIDTKTPLFAELQACEELLEEGYPLDGFNIYIGSSNNEEVCGDGMVEACKYFKEHNIYFDVVLDEGGAITSNMLPGYSGKSAMVAVHEKSRHMYLCKAHLNEKGHGGLNPSEDSAILRLSHFINEVNTSNIYKPHFYPEVQATFETHAPYMKFPMNFLFRHINLFSWIIKKIMSTIPQAKAMLSTSISFTTFFAGSKEDPQIRAKEAECTMFLRCIRENDLNEGLKKIHQIASKHGVTISMIERDYCQPSTFDSLPYKTLEEVMHENFPDVVVAPFLLTAGTDARRFTDVANSILRFTPIDLNPTQFASIHGDNEHIYIRNIGQCVLFYKDFIKKYKENLK